MFPRRISRHKFSLREWKKKRKQKKDQTIHSNERISVTAFTIQTQFSGYVHSHAKYFQSFDHFLKNQCLSIKMIKIFFVIYVTIYLYLFCFMQQKSLSEEERSLRLKRIALLSHFAQRNLIWLLTLN